MRWLNTLIIGAILLATVPIASFVVAPTGLDAADPLSAPFAPTVAAPGGVVINPGAGIMHYPWGWPEREALPYVSGRAGGPFWKQLQPSEGYFDWSVMENWLANLPPGRKTWLRLDASIRADQSLTPEWVFQAGARWVPHTVNGSVKVPVYWDPIFKAKWERTIAALAARYDGDPRLAGVEVNGQGHYGEMVPEWERIFNGDKQTWVHAGYNDQHWIEHQKWAIDMYLKYFKKTPVSVQVVNDGALWGASPARPVLDYAVQKYGMRVHPKWSGLGPNMRGVDNMFLSYVPYTDVIFEENHAFTGSVSEYAQVLDKAIASRASTVYIYWSEFDPAQSGGIDYRPQLERMARYLGPQVFISSAQLPSSALAGWPARITIRWGNRGNLPPRRAQRIGEKDVPVSATAFVDLVDSGGRTVFHYEYQPTVPTTQWYSNTIVEDSVSLPLPGSLAAGIYDVRVGIYNPRQFAVGAPLKLLNAGTSDAASRYQIGKLQVQPQSSWAVKAKIFLPGIFGS